MAQLAKCHFFFSGNPSIRMAANSCGSQLKLNGSLKHTRRSKRLTSRVVNEFNKRSMGMSLQRNFSTVTAQAGLNKPRPTRLVISNYPGQRRQFSTVQTARIGPSSLMNQPIAASIFMRGYFNKGIMARSFSTTKSPFFLATLQKLAAVPNSDNSSKPIPATPFVNKDKNGRPLVTPKYVGYWMLVMAGAVFGIVVLGGLTRLTESGLSITEWKPVTGSIPPLNQEDWEKEFALYRESPEFQILNSNMTIEEFKFIYFMEWVHRLWGRAIGMGVLLPAIYFAAAKKTSVHTNKRLALISVLIGFQGVLGWWMVKSGLDEQFLSQKGSHPRVSQYRLTAHLGAAFLAYIAMFTTGLSIVHEARWTASVNAAKSALETFSTVMQPRLKSFRRIAPGLVGLVFITAMSGGFVAGLDAGLIYNSFPYMGDSLAPPKSDLFDEHYASDKTSSFNVFWKNMLENPVTVQFNHRVMAVTTFSAILGMHLYSIVLKRRQILPKFIFKSGAKSMLFVTLQAALGISTLVYVVPIPLAAAHQAGSLAVLTSVLFLAAKLRLPRQQILKLIEKISKNEQKKTF